MFRILPRRGRNARDHPPPDLARHSTTVFVAPLDETALLEEYRSLRQEIGQRVQFQMLVIGGTVALTTALIPIALNRIDSDSLSFLLAAPIVFAVTAWLYFEQDIFITQAATYLHKNLRPALRSRLPDARRDDVMQWEHQRSQYLFASWSSRRLLDITFAFRLLATLGPGITSLTIAVGIVASAPHPWSLVDWWEWVLAGVDVLLIVFLALLSRHVIRLYRRIASD